MNAHPILLQKKYARIIELLAKEKQLTLDEALELFYHSQVYELMREGCSDMHCMSDLYLVEEITDEVGIKKKIEIIIEKQIRGKGKNN